MDHRTDTTHDAANVDHDRGLIVRKTPIDDVDAAELHWLVHGDSRHCI